MLFKIESVCFYGIFERTQSHKSLFFVFFSAELVIIIIIISKFRWKLSVTFHHFRLFHITWEFGQIAFCFLSRWPMLWAMTGFFSLHIICTMVVLECYKMKQFNCLSLSFFLWRAIEFQMLTHQLTLFHSLCHTKNKKKKRCLTSIPLRWLPD